MIRDVGALARVVYWYHGTERIEPNYLKGVELSRAVHINLSCHRRSKPGLPGIA